MELQPGDIILVKGQSLFSKGVKLFTKSDYTHTTMMISDKQMIEANFYKKVNIVDFKYDPKTMEIYRYKGGLSVSQQINVVQSSYEMLDKYYDYLQIVWYMIEFFIGRHYNSPFHLDNFIICSELIDVAYTNIGINLVPDREKGNVTPDDLFKSNLIGRIY